MSKEKHIMLLFLSSVHLKREAARYMINPCGDDKAKLIETRTTNESAVRYLLDYLADNNAELDKIFGFVSKQVAGPLKDTDGSHLDYFLARLAPYFPAAERFEGVEYDETLAANETLPMVLRMAQQIKSYQTANPEAKIILHADLTGGLRHANMLMLGIMRLLQYSGIEMGKMLYSNYLSDDASRVEEADEIYKLFDLISGAEEFVRFGSVESIIAYYRQRPQTQELQKILAAMGNFAEQIKLCHYGDFTSAIAELKEAEYSFRSSQTSQQEIFGQLLDTLEKEYRVLFRDDVSDIDLIRWCIDKGYLQQALTLYTERVPEYICENLLAIQPALMEKLEKKYGNDSMHRSINYCFMSEYNLIEDNDAKLDDTDKACFESITELQTEFCGELKQILQECCQRDLSEDEVNKRLDKIINSRGYDVEVEGRENIYKFISDWQYLKNHQQLLLNYPTGKHNIDALIASYLEWEKSSDKKESKKFLQIQYGKVRYDKCLKPYLQANIDKMKLAKICGFKLRKKNELAIPLVLMQKYGWLKTELSAEALHQIYADYAAVKQERINSNHAKTKKSSITSRGLADSLRIYLARLEQGGE